MIDVIDFRIDGLPSEQQVENQSREICERVDDEAGLVSKLGWAAIRDQAIHVLQEGLANQDPLSLLSYAWTEAKEVRKAAAESLADESEHCVSLDSHALSQTVNPTVTLELGVSKLEMEFTVELQAGVGCANLILRDGCLVKLGIVRFTPSADLSFKGIKLGHKSWPPFEPIEDYELAHGGWRIADASP